MTSHSNEERIAILTEYIQENQNKLYRLAYSYVRDEQLSLDIIQDAIVKAISKIHTLKQEEYIKTWFYRILLNECLTNVRKRKIKERLDLEEYDIQYQQQDITQAIDLYEYIDQLNPKLKTVVILRFYEDMKLEDIVKVTNTNLSTVKSRLYKALKELRRNMMGEVNCEKME